MRTLYSSDITAAVRKMFIECCLYLPSDAEELIKSACSGESDRLAHTVMERICDNLDAARSNNVPICQDTGMAVVFADLGQDVHIDGSPFDEAVNEGVRQAYRDGYMRCSVVGDPLFGRHNTGDNTPAIIYTRIVPGQALTLDVAPKGFGSENMSASHMFTPSAGRDDIIAFVADTVRRAGGNPCPPILIGVGIGGTFDYSAVMSKRALLRPVSKRSSNPDYAALESDILTAVNKLGIGPQGFGGDTTALAVNIEYAPTHIAGLPVSVNINCHVMRHAHIVL